VIVTCHYCGSTFGAVRPTAKFCSDRCRKRAQRHPEVRGLGRRAPDPAGGEVTAVTARLLVGLGVPEDDHVGRALLVCCRAFDDPHTPASALVSLSRAIQESMSYLRERAES
jgi:hypothetical protein